MMEVYDRFIRLCSDRGARGSLGGTEAVQAEEIPVLGEDNVFLELVTPNRTEVAEIDGSPDSVDLLALVGSFYFIRVRLGVNIP